MELKDWIRDVRSKLGLTQSQFGDLFAVTKGNVSAWENGRHSPSFDQLTKMAAESGVPLPGTNIRQEASSNKQLSLSSNSQSQDEHAQSSEPNNITYEVVRDVVAGALKGFGLSYTDLVTNEIHARRCIEAVLRSEHVQHNSKQEDAFVGTGGEFRKTRRGVVESGVGNDGRKKKPA